MEERIEELETRFMAAEDLIDELNRRVWRQQQEIDLVRAQMRQLADRIKADQPAASVRPEDEVPPHW